MQPQAQTPAPPAPGKRIMPGMWSDMHSMAQMLLRPDVFDGFRFDISKGFGQTYAITHSLMMGSSFVPGGRTYQFGAQCTPDKDTMLMGRLNPADGGVKLVTVLGLAPGLITKVNCDLNRRGAEQPVPSSCLFDVMYRGSDWSSCLNTTMVEGEDLTVKCNLLQSVTQKFALGGEGSYNVGTGNAHVSWGGFLAGADYKGSFTHSMSQGSSDHKFECFFFRRVDQKVSLASQLTTIPSRRVAQASVGYEFNLTQAKVCAMLNTNWQIHATLEERIAPGLSLLFGGILDHAKGTGRFGVGLQVGQ